MATIGPTVVEDSGCGNVIRLGALLLVTVAVGGCVQDVDPLGGPGLFVFSDAPDTIVLEQSQDHVVSTLTDLTVWRGHLVIVDAQEANVKVYNVETGRLTMVIGDSGQGPGEFIAPRGATAIPGDSLVVRDALLQRVSYFDERGVFARAWGFPVASVGGVDVLDGADLVIPGRIVADQRVVSDSAVHRFSPTGVHIRSYGIRHPAPRYGESALDAVHAVGIGDAVVFSQQTTNVLQVVDLSTGTVRPDTVGRSFYRPVDWTLEPPGEGDEEWIRDQMITWYLRDLGSKVYGLGFQEYVGDEEERLIRWVFGDRNGPIVESEPTDAQPAFIKQDRLYSVRMTDRGRVELIIGEAPSSVERALPE